MKSFYTILLVLCFSIAVLGQSKIDWLKTTEALKKAKKNNKTVLLYVKTEWCALCRKLNHEVFSDKEIIEYVNTNFIAAKIDAESKTDIVGYKDKLYSASEYTRSIGVKSYPSVLFLNENGKPIAELKGYYPKKDVKKVLDFIINGQQKNAK